ncbi:cupin domain-containing protein [Aquimarina aquimarini]|uniref:cupin domain-containing protein n=1 Tax=Aquimarina aquimarini TaxID=1191734 RepID=UPI000D55BDFF|nr:cupin domain-containing protein [Aquimarina aquimarini]
MKIISIACCILIYNLGFSQEVIAIDDIVPNENYNNILVKKVYTDANASTFVIWIKDKVNPHIHKEHTEQVFVLEGKAKVWLNGKEQVIKKGDWITIPKQTIHRVAVLSKIPLKVISIQAPKFEGKDRIFID